MRRHRRTFIIVAEKKWPKENKDKLDKSTEAVERYEKTVERKREK